MRRTFFPPTVWIELCFGSGDKIKVSQVWDSKDQLDAFAERLMPILVPHFGWHPRTLAYPCVLRFGGRNEQSSRYQSIFMTGRTSTEPDRAFGTRAAQSMAASNDSTSIRK